MKDEEAFRKASEWSEDDLLRHVRKEAKRHRWKAYHPYNSERSEEGFPDVVLVKPPWVIFTELKVDDESRGKLSPDQLVWKILLEDCPGVRYYLWRPRDFQDILEVLSHGPISVWPLHAGTDRV